MDKFESGISDYVHSPITVDVTFPIDEKGNPHICCDFCRLYTGRKCVLTGEVIYKPEIFVGDRCPLESKEE